tara:strand:+ start:78 stop:1535 length:1458 start_codon:yes stop_codon:yes gene_type:complete
MAAGQSHTLERELSSVYCIYEALELNRNPRTTQEGGIVDPHIKKIWGNTPIPDTDIFAYEHQGQVFKSYLKQIGAPLTGWKYGLFEKKLTKLSSQPGISMETTNIFDEIYQLFSPEQRKKFSSKGTGQKDSWNPADMYIFRGNKSNIIQSLTDLKEKASDLPPNAYIGLVNDYMRILFNDKTLIGISLKTASPPNIPQAEGFNIERDVDFKPHKFGQGVLRKTGNGYLHQYLAVGDKKGKLGFEGNSIRFEAEVDMDGGGQKKFSWESKSPLTGRPHVTEFKKLVSGKKANTLTVAKARGGSIPKDIKFEPLMAEYIKRGRLSWNQMVPKTVLRNAKSGYSPVQQKTAKYWGQYLYKLRKNLMTTLVDAKISRKPSKAKELGLPVVAVDASNGHNTLQNNIDYWLELLWIDGATNKAVKARYGYDKEPKFTENLRGKMRGLIIIQAVVNSQKDNKLGEMLLKAYYTAGKIRWTADDLQGPFVKIE